MAKDTVNITCISCGKVCEDYRELASHIAGSKKGHRKGKRWAAQYLSRHVLNKREYNNRTPMTAEQKTTKDDIMRIVSGEQRVADTVCPKCKKPSRAVFEIEYAESSSAWRIGGRLVKMCDGCA